MITLGTKGGGKEVSGGSIAILPYNDGNWGAPDVIVPSTGTTDNNFFPAWSPDSKWLVYVNATASSKDAVSATLRLINVIDRQPIVLKRLNERVNNADANLLLGNSMPTWAPSTKPGTFWLAFSSLRPATIAPSGRTPGKISSAAASTAAVMDSTTTATAQPTKPAASPAWTTKSAAMASTTTATAWLTTVRRRRFVTTASTTTVTVSPTLTIPLVS